SSAHAAAPSNSTPPAIASTTRWERNVVMALQCPPTGASPTPAHRHEGSLIWVSSGRWAGWWSHARVDAQRWFGRYWSVIERWCPGTNRDQRGASDVCHLEPVEFERGDEV